MEMKTCMLLFSHLINSGLQHFFFTNSCWIRVEKNEIPSDIVWANAAPMATIAVVRHFFSMTHVLIPSFSLTLTLSMYFPLAMSYITIELYFPSFRLFY